MNYKNNNYPIKYAIMPIYKQTGWSHGLNELERSYGIVYYIVSKCYLIKEIKTYDGDGKSKMSYEVVFPFQPKGRSINYEREYPEYNYQGQCYNSDIVEEIYEANEIEKLNEIVTKMNKKLYSRGLSFASYSEKNMESFKTNFSWLEEECAILKQEIEKETKDMMFEKLDDQEQIKKIKKLG